MKSAVAFAVAVALVLAACGDSLSEEVPPVTEVPGNTVGDDAAQNTTDTAPEEPTEPAATATSAVPPTQPELTITPTTEPKPAPTTTAPAQQPPPTTLTEPVPGQAMVDIAKADLSSRLGVEPAEIGVVSIAEVTWRDGSLGCPQPDMAYTQVISNGTQIILLSNGVQFHYHAGLDGAPFYCATPQEPLPPDAGGYGDV